MARSGRACEKPQRRAAGKRVRSARHGEDTMSVVGIDTGFELGAAPSGPDEISRRLEAMPGTAYVWRLVILLSLGGCFEIYDLFLTGYVAPGLSRSGLLSTT